MTAKASDTLDNGFSTSLVPVKKINTPPAPMSLDTIERIAGHLAASGFFSDAKDASKAVAKVLAGHELGFGPFCSMANVYIINGRACLSAVMMASAIKKTARYNYRVKVHTPLECQIEFLEYDVVCGLSSFTMDDAKKAGLTSNQTWTKYPRNMLFSRAMSNGAKWYTPDVFGGNTPYTPDEIQPDLELDEEGSPLYPTYQPSTTTTAASKPKRQRRGAAATALKPTVVEASFEVKKPKEELRKELDVLINELNVDVEKFLDYYQHENFDDFAADELAQAVDLLKKRKDQQKVSTLPSTISP